MIPETEMTYITGSGLGDRHQQIVDGVTTNYTLDLAAGLTQVLGDGTNTYLYGNGRIAQAGSTTEYFLGDALGSVRQLVDPAGAVTLTQSYAPYGETTSSVGDGYSAYQYTGEIRDASGLTYLWARYLDSNTGRFISRDTWNGDYNRPLSLNRWNYVEGNPVNYVDPTGNYPHLASTLLKVVSPKVLSYIFDCSELPNTSNSVTKPYVSLMFTCPPITSTGMGTVVSNENTIVTAKHIVPSCGTLDPSDILSIVDVNGTETEILISDIAFSFSGNRDIATLTLPLKISLGIIPATPTTNYKFKRGNSVTIAYQDATRNIYAATTNITFGSVKIPLPMGGATEWHKVAVAENPSSIINRGDSGGGVFHDGGFVGVNSAVFSFWKKDYIGVTPY